MNLLVVGGTQIFQQDGWRERLGITRRQDTGNAMDLGDVAVPGEVAVDEVPPHY